MKRFWLVLVVLLVGCASKAPSIYDLEERDFYDNLVPLLQKESKLTPENLGNELPQIAAWETVMGKVKSVDVRETTRVRGRTWFLLRLGMQDGSEWRGSIVYVPEGAGFNTFIYPHKTIPSGASSK